MRQLTVRFLRKIIQNTKHMRQIKETFDNGPKKPFNRQARPVIKRHPFAGLAALGLFAALFFSACGTVERPAKPSATGRAGEMLVVMETMKWEGRAGEYVRDAFQQLEPMFLQPEPRFDLVQIHPDNFIKMFESHRHIFMAEIDPALQRPTIEITRDVWSHPQLVVRVKAPSDSILQRVMERNTEAFIDHYVAVERERLINAYRRMTNQEARLAVRDMFGVNMTVPEGFFPAVKGEDFIWLRRTGTREDLDLGVLIATLPYRNPDVDFAHETIQARRDSLTKKYIPGQFPGSYMTTYPELTPDFREINFNGRYAIEARSLWRVEGDHMGGPFVNYTVVDESTNRVFIIDGFVYGPKYDKRDYMRQVMAVIYSLEFPESPDEPQTVPEAEAAGL